MTVAQRSWCRILGSPRPRHGARRRRARTLSARSGRLTFALASAARAFTYIGYRKTSAGRLVLVLWRSTPPAAELSSAFRPRGLPDTPRERPRVGHSRFGKRVPALRAQLRRAPARRRRATRRAAGRHGRGPVGGDHPVRGASGARCDAGGICRVCEGRLARVPRTTTGHASVTRSTRCAKTRQALHAGSDGEAREKGVLGVRETSPDMSAPGGRLATGRARRFDSPLVGREQQLGALRSAFAERRAAPRLPSADGARAGRDRQVAPGRGVRGGARRGRDRAARPLPALRRGHHVLAADRGRARDPRAARDRPAFRVVERDDRRARCRARRRPL